MGKNVPWLPEEDRIIAEHFPGGGIDACYPLLRARKRSAHAIYQRSKRLKKTGKIMAMRLRAFADAVLGKSDLKVGPQSTAALFIEAAEFIERSVPR